MSCVLIWRPNPLLTPMMSHVCCAIESSPNISALVVVIVTVRSRRGNLINGP
jgi:hypothetical protein